MTAARTETGSHGDRAAEQPWEHAAWRELPRRDGAWRDAPCGPEALVAALSSAARAAARVVRDGAARRLSLEWESKGAADYVTEVDRAAEQMVRTELARSPAAVIPVEGEESWTGDALPGGWSIIVDPLDGTTNFLHGFPQYAVSVAALSDGEPVAGVVLDVVSGAEYVAVRGGGAFRDRVPIGVSRVSDPARALIGTGIPFGGNAPLERYAPQLAAVARDTAGVRRAGSAAMDLAWVAAGSLDAFWELYLSPWDVAAGLLLVREAGGVATAPDGSEARVERGPLVAGNPAMHRWLLETLERAR